MDNGSISSLPFFTYRASSSMKPEMLRPGPGDGIPLNDPTNDIKWQNIPNVGQSFWLNTLGIVRQMSERLTLQGDLQAGRVPGGVSSALRTLGGIQTLLSQGEARPERILRRFFMALNDVFRHMHRWNRYFLPSEKAFSMSPDLLEPKEDPWRTVAKSDVDIDLEFDFHANVQNSSKQAIQASLMQLIQLYVSPIAVQLGITTPDTVYRLFRDIGKAVGQETSPYLQPPSPQSDLQPIGAPEAVMMLDEGILPDGSPMEGATRHLQLLQEIMEWDTFGEFNPANLSLLKAYLERMAQMAQQEQQLLAQQQAAAQLNGGGSGNPVGRPAEQPVDSQPGVVPENSVADATLPVSRGGV